jgi:hypothetical protein
VSFHSQTNLQQNKKIQMGVIHSKTFANYISCFVANNIVQFPNQSKSIFSLFLNCQVEMKHPVILLYHAVNLSCFSNSFKRVWLNSDDLAKLDFNRYSDFQTSIDKKWLSQIRFQSITRFSTAIDKINWNSFSYFWGILYLSVSEGKARGWKNRLRGG